MKLSSGISRWSRSRSIHLFCFREYEGPFGEWHQERLCQPREFLKQGQQNYQEYQGMWVGECWMHFVKVNLRHCRWCWFKWCQFHLQQWNWSRCRSWYSLGSRQHLDQLCVLSWRLSDLWVWNQGTNSVSWQLWDWQSQILLLQSGFLIYYFYFNMNYKQLITQSALINNWERDNNK